jgi:nucleotide-binding universal stress UspA family protein
MDAKTFVVPLDGSENSERALPVAEALAGRVGGKLLLVSAEFHGPLRPREYLGEQAARVVDCPVDVLASTRERAAVVVETALADDENRVVCMTTHGRGSWRWAAVGSVAEEIIQRTDRPLLLVGRHCRTDFLARGKDLLVCADRAEAAPGLASAVHDWAAALDLHPRVAVVVHPLDVESAEHAEGVLDPIAQAFGLPPDDALLLRRNYVAGALADCADDCPAALIAINTHARTGLQRFALGSETMAVVHLAPCPVLVTRRRSTADPLGGVA